MRKSVKLYKLLLVAILFVLFSINRSFAITQEQIPNGTIEIAYKQLIDGTAPSLSNSVGLRTALWFGDLINFSGAVIKQSDILNKVISWQLVPLKGRSVIIKPSCEINLKGIPQ